MKEGFSKDPLSRDILALIILFLTLIYNFGQTHISVCTGSLELDAPKRSTIIRFIYPDWINLLCFKSWVREA